MKNCSITVVALLVSACGYDDVVLAPEQPVAAPLRDAGLDGAPPRDAGSDGAPLMEAGVGPGRFSLSAGQFVACATPDGRLYCWGDLDETLAGDQPGSAPPERSPFVVSPLDGWDDVGAGEAHVCGLRGGVVWCWGDGSLGQLGQSSSSSSSPLPVTALPRPAQAITVGYRHSCAILDDASVWCWGRNSFGELGAPGTPGEFSAVPARVGDHLDWIEVVAGQFHTCGIRDPGALYCWGLTDNGRAGLGDTPPELWLPTPTRVGSATDWVQIDIGQEDGCGVRRDGRLYCWGVWRRLPPVGEPETVGSDTDWVQVSTDAFSRCGVRKDGGLWCWGRNVEGQLGTGDWEESDVPRPVADARAFQQVSVGRFFACALDQAQTVRCTGKNQSGELGLGDSERRNTFTPLAF